MSVAQVSHVQVRLGRPIEAGLETDQVTAWLEDVEALIMVRIPDLLARVANGSLAAGLVILVEAQAVVRKVKNPDGKQNERIDDYSYGLVADSARGELFLTDDEWAMLAPAAAPMDAFSAHVRWEPDHHSRWL